MKRWLFSLALLLGLLGLVACAPAEEATPVPGPPTPAAKAPWEEEWERVLAAAKQEGKVTVKGPRGEPARRALSEAFEKGYGIQVEYEGVPASELVTRIEVERAAGKYLVDIVISGASTFTDSLKPMGILDPIEPALFLPEVKDGKNWLGGKLEFVDAGRQALVSTTYTSAPVYINTSLVKPGEVKSYRDLLEPKWKGKIVALDPRIGGPGQGSFHFFYARPDLGPDFIRQLAKQEITLLRVYDQPPETLARGKAAICIGCVHTDIDRFAKEGLPVDVLDPRTVKEGGHLAAGSGVVMLMNKAPHPNAAKVWLNWFLTKEAQTEFNRVQGYASRRLDVANAEWMRPWELPIEGFLPRYKEEVLKDVQEKVIPLIRELFGR